MRNFFNGKSGLAVTYWIGFVGAGVLVRIVDYWLTNQYMTAGADADFSGLDLFLKVFVVTFCLYLWVLLRAMVKAGFDNRRPGFWGWIGIVLVTFGALSNTYTAATTLFPNLTTPIFMLEMELRALKKQLPMKMDEGTTMTRVGLVGDTLTYYVTLDYEIDDFTAAELQKPMISNEIGRELCVDLEGYFKGGLNFVAYEYAYANRTVTQTLSGDNCVKWLTVME